MRELGVGFSYRGIHSDDMGVTLGNNTEVMHSISSDFTASSETVDGYNGAYPTGTKEGAKEFTIKLLCEEMTDAQLARLGWWFERGSGGELIFDHAPYKHYVVRVTSEVVPPTYVFYDRPKGIYIYSGVAEVKLTAYVPRAYMNDDVLTDYPNVGTGRSALETSTGIVEASARPATSKINPSASDTLLLLNQGNANAKAIIECTGVMSGGVTITNTETGRAFTLTAPDSNTHTYIVNGRDGITYEMIDGTKRLAANVKVGNFIEILPSMSPFYRGVSCSSRSGSVTLNRPAPGVHVGQYVHVRSGWNRITAINGNTLTVEGTLSGGYSCDIATLNKITIECGTGSSLDSISFTYKDTFY